MQYLSHRLGHRYAGIPAMPLALTFAVTNRCNCRCRTCGVYERRSEELSFGEIKEIFAHIGPRIYWLTFSGGEPFLRDDFGLICSEAYRALRPRFITIPTNGINSDDLAQRVSDIVQSCNKSTIILNLSIDGMHRLHDDVRGRTGAFQEAIRTYEKLRKIRSKNFTLGIHTVLSKYNAGSFLELLEYIKELQPDSYIVEYAQRRRELHNTQKDFIAAEDEYARCIDMLQGCRGGTDKKGAQRYIAILRKHYYSLSKEILRYKRQVIPCFAGFASAHIAADGEVWACGVAAHSMGALRHAGYRFQALWLDKKAQEARNSIKQQRCYCLNANSAYQNMLFNGRYLWKIGLDFFRA